MALHLLQSEQNGTIKFIFEYTHYLNESEKIVDLQSTLNDASGIKINSCPQEDFKLSSFLSLNPLLEIEFGTEVINLRIVNEGREFYKKTKLAYISYPDGSRIKGALYQLIKKEVN